jgi:hypothetical protein
MTVKSALLLRVVLLVAASVLAAAASVTSRSGGESRQSRVQLNGRSTQGFPIFAVERGGRVRAFHMVWRAACADGGTLPWAFHTFRESKERFARHGRAFSVARSNEGAPTTGRVPHASEELRGRVSSDGDRAWGEFRGTVVWTRRGRVLTTCSSGPVPWRLRAPG